MAGAFSSAFSSAFDIAAGIQRDTQSTSGYSTNSSFNWGHTCNGNNRFLRVDIEMLSVAGTSVTGITYNSTPLTKIGSISSALGAVRVESWGLINPDSGGSFTIAATLSATTAFIGTGESYTGVHQTTPYEGVSTATATNVGAADATVNVVSVADNCMIVNAVATDDTAITVGTGETSENNQTGALGSGAAASSTATITPAGTTAAYWTAVGAGATWSIIGYALRPVGAPTGTTYTISISDSIAITDTGGFSRIASGNRFCLDNLGFNETYSRIVNSKRLYSDNLGIPTETVSRIANANRLVADNLGFNEAYVRIANANRLYSDNLGFNETFARISNASRLYSDSLGFNETFSRIANAFRVVTDSIGIVDGAVLLLTGGGTFIIQISDSLGFNETFARIANARRVLTDSVGIRNDYATITFDNAATSGYKAALGTYSWNHSTTGDFLIVDVQIFASSGSVASLSYGGEPLSLLGTTVTQNNLRVEKWGLVAPAAGTAAIVINFTGTVDSICDSISYSGVDQQIPTEQFLSVISAGGSGDPNLFGITKVSGSWLLPSCAVISDTFSAAGAGQTIRENVSGASGAGVYSDYATTTAGTYPVSFTTNSGGTNAWTITTIALRPQPTFFRRVTSSRAVSTNFGFNETYRRRANALRLVTDNLAITDSAILELIGAGTRVIRIADNIGIAELFDRRSDAYRTLSENLVGLSDIADRIVNTVRLMSDSFGIQPETVSRIVTARRLATDNLGWGEGGFTRIADANRLVQDRIAFSETFIRIAHALRRYSDNFGIAEAITVQAIQSGIIIVDFVEGNTNVWFSEERPLTYTSEARGLVFEQVAPTSDEMAPIELEKYDAESRRYDFDFTDHPEILEGETIISATVTATPTGLTLGALSITSPHVYQRISGGGNGEYLLTCEVVTTNANITVGYGKLVTRTTPISHFVQRKIKYTSESREYAFDLSNFPELTTSTVGLAGLNSTPPTGLSFGSLDIDGSTLTCRLGSGAAGVSYLLQLDVTTVAGDTLQDFFYLQVQTAMPSNLQTVLREFDHESRLYDFDFSETPEFEAGVTVGNSITVAMTPHAFITTLGIGTDRIQVRIDEPTASTTYSLVCTIVTSGGDTLKAFGRLHVAAT